MSISTLKWPVLARIAPSFIRSMCSPRMTPLSPVAVTKMSPTSAAFAIGSTSKPSITASSAFIGSTSVTITCAPMPLGARREAAAAPAVARDDELLPASSLFVARMIAVDRRLAGAVAVVEEVLRLRLVDGDDREAERAVALERLQADDAGRRLLGAADHVAELLAAVCVEHADHVGAVVHRDLRLVVDRGLDVRVVRVVVLALDREDRDVVLLDERGGDVVLRGERVRRAEDDVGAAGLQRARQVRRLGRHVQAGRDAVAVERLLALEALADRRAAPACCGRPTRCGERPPWRV